MTNLPIIYFKSFCLSVSENHSPFRPECHVSIIMILVSLLFYNFIVRNQTQNLSSIHRRMNLCSNIKKPEAVGKRGQEPLLVSLKISKRVKFAILRANLLSHLFFSHFFPKVKRSCLFTECPQTSLCPPVFTCNFRQPVYHSAW